MPLKGRLALTDVLCGLGKVTHAHGGTARLPTEVCEFERTLSIVAQTESNPVEKIILNYQNRY